MSDQALNKLEKLYKDGDFDGAKSFLESSKENFKKDLYYYNLGTIYIKKGELGKARFYLELAKEYGFKSSMVDNNIEFIKKELGVTSLEQNQPVLDTLSLKMTTLSNQWSLTFLIFGALISFLIFKKGKSLLAALFVLIFFALPIGFRAYQRSKFSIAVVSKASQLREGPSKVFDPSGEIPEGLKIFITDPRDQVWYFIEHPKEFRGWVNSSNLNILSYKL
jgi:tetratricopeptide (TPR) repeat protein